jgi:hypothetical protein
MQVTLDWWNFEESVTGFFIHCIAIAGFYMAVTYYAMKWLQHQRNMTSSIERGTEIPRGPKAATHSDRLTAVSDQRV